MTDLEYSQYVWIRNSIDSTIAEAEEVKALNEKLKNSTEIEKFYYYFPPHIIKNPSMPVFFELEGEDGLILLEYRISEN